MSKLEEMERALTEALRYQSELEQALERVISKRQRDRREEEVVFALELPDGSIRHEGNSFELALEASKFYDDARIVSQVRQPWKIVSPAEEEEVEGN